MNVLILLSGTQQQVHVSHALINVPLAPYNPLTVHHVVGVTAPMCRIHVTVICTSMMMVHQLTVLLVPITVINVMRMDVPVVQVPSIEPCQAQPVHARMDIMMTIPMINCVRYVIAHA